jgi:hypothetical protein
MIYITDTKLPKIYNLIKFQGSKLDGISLLQTLKTVRSPKYCYYQYMVGKWNYKGVIALGSVVFI